MRIVIETNEQGDAVRLQPAGGEAATGAADAAVSDGGAGPSATTTGGGDGTPAGDAGPPPSWLLDAVGTAEAAGGHLPLAVASDLDAALPSDAGAGPVAEPLPYDT